VLAVHIIVGLLLATALLYFWLVGHWFARVLVFLVFASLPLAWFVGAVASGGHLASSVAGGITGVVAAWFAAGIPIYYRRRQIMLEEERIKTLAGGRVVAPRKHRG
jgi:hypothetical protein